MIDSDTRLGGFQKELRWNDAYCWIARSWQRVFGGEKDDRRIRYRAQAEEKGDHVGEQKNEIVPAMQDWPTISV